MPNTSALVSIGGLSPRFSTACSNKSSRMLVASSALMIYQPPPPPPPPPPPAPPPEKPELLELLGGEKEALKEELAEVIWSAKATVLKAAQLPLYQDGGDL